MEFCQEQYEEYMKEALLEAQKAYDLLEVPIGCVIVRDGKIIARGYNRRNTDKSCLAHAEIEAIREASRVVGDWRLEDCTLFVTLEPCQMCAGAIVQARMKTVVIGCMNAKAGCAGSIYNLLEEPAFNHQVETIRGILETECSAIVSDFFKSLRQKKNLEKYQKKAMPVHMRNKRRKEIRIKHGRISGKNKKIGRTKR